MYSKWIHWDVICVGWEMQIGLHFVRALSWRKRAAQKCVLIDKEPYEIHCFHTHKFIIFDSLKLWVYSKC